jgi:pilus assembly protein CpaB
MRPATLIMFAIAFVCAGIAAYLIRGVLSRGGEQPVVTVVQPLNTVKVVVAARDMKPGEKLDAAALREVSWPADSVPKGAFTSKDALLKVAAERQVVVAVAEKEPVLQSKLLGFSDGAQGRPGEGMTGVTIRVNDTSIGGVVQPGDHVDVLMTQTERVGEITGGKAYTITLLRNVRVLAVDQQAIVGRTQAQSPKTITLEVTSDDAKKLTLASTIGQLSLTLNPGGSWNSIDSGVIDINDLLRLQPAKPVGAAIDLDPVVTVTRSVERKDYKVPDEVHR